MKLTIEKADLLKVLEKINDGALKLPQHKVLEFVRGRKPCEEFEAYVNSLMLAMASLIELNDPTVTRPEDRVLPKEVVPIKMTGRLAKYK